MKKNLFLSVLLAAASVLPAGADSLPRPAGAAFGRGALFTVDGYAAGRPALEGFPVLVRISAGSPEGFAYDQLQSSATGADLAFVDMDGGGLPFEIDTWDPSGESLVWVRLPSMENGTRFGMCWGSATSGKTVCADDPWSGWTGVWHLGETAGGATTVADSTANGLSGSTVASSSSKTDGRIGRARHVTTDAQNNPGLDSGITVDLSDAAKRAAVDGLGTEFTASMWVRVSADYNFFYLIGRKNADECDAWGVQTLNGTAGQIRLFSSGTASGHSVSPKLPVALGAKNEWHKLDFVWKSDGTYVVYQDGANKVSDSLYDGRPAAQGSLGLSLGGALRNADGKGGRGLDGDLDEVRLRAFVPDDDWAAADWAAQADPAFLSAGAAEDVDDAGPSARLSAAAAGYTGATARARLYSLGENARSATVRVEISDAEDFSSAVWSDEAEVQAAGLVEFAATGLPFGTALWARATVTNDLGADVSLGPVAFATPSPGAPEGTAELAVRGFTTLSASCAATAFGEGASSATMRLEASEDEDFATIAGASAEVAAVAGTPATLEIAGLAPGTEYRLRLRLANDWGVATNVPLPAAATLDGPFDASGIRWTFSEDVSRVDVAFDVVAVFAGATGEATLYCDEAAEPETSRGVRTVSAPGALEWPDIPFGDDALHAKVVLVSDAGGAVYTQAWDAVIDLAFKRPKLVSSAALASRWAADGTTPGPEPGSVFDGDFSTGIFSAAAGDSVIVDFTSLFPTNEPNRKMYVGDVLAAHGVSCPHSLYVSPDGETWTAVAGAQNVSASGMSTYSVRTWVRKVKYVFESARTSDFAPLLSELQVYGYVSDAPHVVSRAEVATMHWADGTLTGNNGREGFGGGNDHGTIDFFFDGIFTEGTYIGANGRLNNGGFVLLDFSSEMPDGWFVPEIRAGSASANHAYSLSYSPDGTTWIPVEGGTGVKAIGEKAFPVNDNVVLVKCVFDQVGGWTPTFAELQVWGMDPADVPCRHPQYTAWEAVPDSATCTEYGVDEQFCTTCGARVVRENRSILPIGHDFVSRLARPGKYRRFGRGAFGCSRCGYLFECPEPMDLVTNEVDGARVGIVQTKDLFPFTTVTVSSTGDTGYGVRPGHLVNDLWDWHWNHYWYSDAPSRDPAPRADYAFGTDVDLIWIDVSVPNDTHVVRFFSVDPGTGAETPLGGFFVERTDPVLGDEFHVWRAEDDPYEDPYGGEVFDCIPVEKDAGIPSTKRNETGEEILEDDAPVSNSYNQYQRFLVRFYETRVRHLRIRQYKADGETPRAPMYISELHPWGTVPGAGDWRHPRETLFYFK